MTTHSSAETSGEVGKGHAKGQHAKEHGNEDAVTVRVREGIAVIVFDVPGEKQNTLSERSSAALRKAFERLSDDPALKGAVLISGKTDFIAGADISMMQHAKSAADCERMRW